MSEHTRPFSRRAFVGGAAAFGISLCLPPLMPAKAHAVTAAEKQAEANAALEKLNAMQEKLDRAEVSLYAAETERDDAQARMDEAQGRIDSASSRISELQDKLGNRARSMYRSGSSTFLDLLLGATTFQAFASNWDLLNDMNQNDADMVEETKTLRSEAVYEEQRNVAAQKAEEAEAVKKEAESLVSQMQDTYNSLSEEAAQLLAEEEAAREAAALAAAQAAEEEARRQAEEEERRQQQSNSGGNSGGGSGSGGNSGGSSSGGSGSSGGGSSSNNSKPQTVGGTAVDRAYGELGKPYSWGAVGPDSYDCSGLVSYCLLGRHSRLGTAASFMGYTRVSNPKPGDICCNDHHCGIYIGDGQMIHAPRTGDVVKISAVHSGMIYTRY